MIKNILNRNDKKRPEVVIVKNINDIDYIIFQLKKGYKVIVNAKGLSLKDATHFFDFLCGFCYGRNGKSKKIEKMIFSFEL